MGGMPHFGGPPSWSPVNIVFPLTVGASDADTPEHLAVAHWMLPRVPAVGEEVEAMGHRVKVERVSWWQNGKVSIRLAETRVGVDGLETLERDGWSVHPWEEDPPEDWFR